MWRVYVLEKLFADRRGGKSGTARKQVSDAASSANILDDCLSCLYLVGFLFARTVTQASGSSMAWLPKAESLWSTFRVTLLALLQAWYQRLQSWAERFGKMIFVFKKHVYGVATVLQGNPSPSSRLSSSSFFCCRPSRHVFCKHN